MNIYTNEEMDQIRTTTSGFYKGESPNLLFGRFYVLNANYELWRNKKDEYTYPVDGWRWFETEEEARIHYNIPKEDLPPPPEPELPPPFIPPPPLL